MCYEQEIGWKECLQGGSFCVKWDEIKPEINQSINQSNLTNL